MTEYSEQMFWLQTEGLIEGNVMAEQEGFRKCKGMCRPDIYSEAGNREGDWEGEWCLWCVWIVEGL